MMPGDVVDQEVFVLILIGWLAFPRRISGGRQAAREAGADPLKHHRLHETGGPHPLAERRSEVSCGLIGGVELGGR